MLAVGKEFDRADFLGDATRQIDEAAAFINPSSEHLMHDPLNHHCNFENAKNCAFIGQPCTVKQKPIP